MLKKKSFHLLPTHYCMTLRLEVKQPNLLVLLSIKIMNKKTMTDSKNCIHR